jgi:hypothetical protein
MKRKFSLAVGVYESEYGTDAFVAFTNAQSPLELPKMTNEKLSEWFGVIDADLKEGDIPVPGHRYATFEWRNLIPLSDIPVI